MVGEDAAQAGGLGVGEPVIADQLQILRSEQVTVERLSGAWKADALDTASHLDHAAG